MIEPSDAERAMWPHATRDYVAALEAKHDIAQRALEEIAHPPYGIGFNRLRGLARAALTRLA